MFGDRYFGKRYFGNRYFGPGAAGAQVLQQPGGGFYRRHNKPTIYLDRDGKPVDLRTYGREPAPSALIETLELSPQVMAALQALMPQSGRPQLTDLTAGLDTKMGRMMIEREVAAMADDDALAALLLC
ncbi:hypothetical protein [Mesorhizobium sp. M1396]|uniref:hypothetical protein n=1 Tax=Mesorhizobium sp. M1396 TaxID=2957095 RepID=UPI00333C1CBA